MISFKERKGNDYLITTARSINKGTTILISLEVNINYLTAFLIGKLHPPP